MPKRPGFVKNVRKAFVQFCNQRRIEYVQLLNSLEGRGEIHTLPETMPMINRSGKLVVVTKPVFYSYVLRKGVNENTARAFANFLGKGGREAVAKKTRKAEPIGHAVITGRTHPSIVSKQTKKVTVQGRRVFASRALSLGIIKVTSNRVVVFERRGKSFIGLYSIAGQFHGGIKQADVSYTIVNFKENTVKRVRSNLAGGVERELISVYKSFNII